MGLSYNFMPIDPSAVIAPTAVVSPNAVIGPGVRIGEFCIIEPEVIVGAHCVLDAYVYIKRWTTLGARNEVGAGTVLGTDPLDKNFDGARSYLRIGDDNKIREHFTISRGITFASSSGEPARTSTPSSARRFVISGVCSALPNAS